MTTIELTQEQVAYRALLAEYKTAIKADAIDLKAEKAERRTVTGETLDVLQSRLSTHRLQARARLLIYGTLRGRSWDRMEPIRRPNSRLPYYIAKEWNTHATDVAMPEALKEFK